MELRFEKANRDHAEILMTGMTPIVLEELTKAYKSTDIVGLLDQAFGHRSVEANAAFVDNELVCVMGVSTKTVLSNVGHPWLIPHTNINKHKYEFLSASRNWVKHLSSLYPVLENHVLGKNERALRWLK